MFPPGWRGAWEGTAHRLYQEEAELDTHKPHTHETLSVCENYTLQPACLLSPDPLPALCLFLTDRGCLACCRCPSQAHPHTSLFLTWPGHSWPPFSALPCLRRPARCQQAGQALKGRRTWPCPWGHGEGSRSWQPRNWAACTATQKQGPLAKW